MLSPGGVRPASTISEESSSNEVFEGFTGMDGKKTVNRRRVGNAQRQVAAVRMVNATQRGELAGQKTAFSTDSAQLSTEISAQSAVNFEWRVNEQVRRCGCPAFPPQPSLVRSNAVAILSSSGTGWAYIQRQKSTPTPQGWDGGRTQANSACARGGGKRECDTAWFTAA